MENRRRQVNPEIRESVDLSFQIVDRIHEILVEKGLKQKDLALLLGKKEAEISKWMRGTHNFTIDTLVTIERALQAHIFAGDTSRRGYGITLLVYSESAKVHRQPYNQEITFYRRKMCKKSHFSTIKRDLCIFYLVKP